MHTHGIGNAAGFLHLRGLGIGLANLSEHRSCGGGNAEYELAHGLVFSVHKYIYRALVFLFRKHHAVFHMNGALRKRGIVIGMRHH